MREGEVRWDSGCNEVEWERKQEGSRGMATGEVGVLPCVPIHRCPNQTMKMAHSIQ